MLPEKYQTLITHEINRILRDLNKLTSSNSDQQNKEETKQPWRRNDIRDELERAKREIDMAIERALEAEKKAELSEVRARLAEEKSKGPPHQHPPPPPSGVDPNIQTSQTEPSSLNGSQQQLELRPLTVTASGMGAEDVPFSGPLKGAFFSFEGGKPLGDDHW